MKVYKAIVGKHFPDGTTLGEILSKITAMPSEQLREAALKGAVWVQKGKGKTLRERSLTSRLLPLDTVNFFHDQKVLSLPELKEAECLYENDKYGVWFKAAGVVTQGTQTGDHASLIRFIEKKKNKEIFLVHRLDRETAGLMVFAYTSGSAGKLSDLFQHNKITKEYEAIVLGEMKSGEKGTVNVALDGKRAVTHYEVLECREGRSLLRVKIETGRLHQIRRHLDHIGHPVMGDPKYGKGNKNKEGLMLLASTLSFIDPWDAKSKSWSSPFRLSL